MLNSVAAIDCATPLHNSCKIRIKCSSKEMKPKLRNISFNKNNKITIKTENSHIIADHYIKKYFKTKIKDRIKDIQLL